MQDVRNPQTTHGVPVSSAYPNGVALVINIKVGRVIDLHDGIAGGVDVRQVFG